MTADRSVIAKFEKQIEAILSLLARFRLPRRFSARKWNERQIGYALNPCWPQRHFIST